MNRLVLLVVLMSSITACGDGSLTTDTSGVADGANRIIPKTTKANILFGDELATVGEGAAGASTRPTGSSVDGLTWDLQLTD